MQSIIKSLLGLAIVAIVGATLATSADASTERGGNKANKVEGKIVSVDVANLKVTIKTQAGALVSVQANAATKIERNGFHSTLAAFKVGDVGQAVLNPTTKIATKIEATGT